MAGQGKWSNPVPLKNFAESPQEGGKYEIGALTAGGTRSGQKVFAAAYSGDAQGAGVTIRGRLGDHYGGVVPTGNAEVDEQLKGGQKDNLSCRWKVEKPKKARQPKAKEATSAAAPSS